MHIIYLPGNSAGNKDWIKKVKAAFDKFSTGEILYYDHWRTGKKWLNLEAESRKLTKLIEGQPDYFVFAKSAGTGLALKNIFEKKFNPKKAIFCGFPTVRYLEYPLVPTIFVQNEFDPVCPFAKLEKALLATPPAAPYQLIKNAGIHSHDYDNFDQLVDLVKDFFVDESGDPTFYDKHGNLIVGHPGISEILLLGFIKTGDPKPIRKALAALREQIAEDKYLKGIPSLNKSLIAFHAKDDCPEIRERVFRTITGLDFTAEVFVARKIQNIFNVRHHRSESEFYDDLISKLFENKLHLAKNNQIFFAVRGTKVRQAPVEEAIQKAILTFENKWKKRIESTIRINPQRPSGEPCLQVIDYVNWAIQRAFIKKDERFYKFIEEKIAYLVDIYDTDKYPKNFYNKKNKFVLKKISPL